jgi:hypothetical protein
LSIVLAALGLSSCELLFRLAFPSVKETVRDETTIPTTLTVYRPSSGAITLNGEPVEFAPDETGAPATWTTFTWTGDDTRECVLYYEPTAGRPEDYGFYIRDTEMCESTVCANPVTIRLRHASLSVSDIKTALVE